MREKSNMVGKILNEVNRARKETRIAAVESLWKRNGLEKVTDRKGYKLAETPVTYSDGTEVIEYRLYKMMDASVVIISSEVSTTTIDGVESLRENNR